MAKPQIYNLPVLHIPVHDTRTNRERALIAQVRGAGLEFAIKDAHHSACDDRNEHPITVDDAQFVHEYLIPRTPRDQEIGVRKQVTDLLKKEWIFEVGIDEPWMPLHTVSHWRQYADAEQEAKRLLASLKDSIHAHVVIQPLEIR